MSPPRARPPGSGPAPAARRAVARAKPAPPADPAAARPSPPRPRQPTRPYPTGPPIGSPTPRDPRPAATASPADRAAPPARDAPTARSPTPSPGHAVAGRPTPAAPAPAPTQPPARARRPTPERSSESPQRPAVPAVLVLRDAPLRRIPQRLVDRQRRHRLVVTPQPLAGDHEVQVQLHQQPEQQRMRPYVDLRERVVEQHQPRRIRRRTRQRGEVRRRGREQRQVAQHLLLALRQRRPPVQLEPLALGLRPGVLDPEREPPPVVQRRRQVLPVGQLR